MQREDRAGDEASIAFEHRFRRQNYCLRVWRRGRSLHLRGIPWLPQAVRVLCQVVFHADIPVQVDIPRGVVFMHNGLGTVIHTRVRFAGPAIVFHNVTIGNRTTADDRVPTIGRRVFIGAGAVIIGDIEIGDDCIIGANSVVTASVPSGHRAVGSPARISRCADGVIDELFPGVPASTPGPRRAAA